MRRSVLVVFLLLMSLTSAGFQALAVQVTELGIQVHIFHDPLLSGGELRLAAAVSGYCRLFMDDGWTVRAQIGSPIDLFLPQIGVATTHAVGANWAVEAQLWMQTDFLDSVYFTLNGGGRVRVAGSGTSRMTLSSFPISLAALYDSLGFLFVPSAHLNAYVDLSWAPSDHLVLGQTIGLSIARLGSEYDAAFPLDGIYGLTIESVTRAGYMP
jgi:hypothetical protein